MSTHKEQLREIFLLKNGSPTRYINHSDGECRMYLKFKIRGSLSAFHSQGDTSWTELSQYWGLQLNTLNLPFGG
jgi:hypothetical protein